MAFGPISPGSFIERMKGSRKVLIFIVYVALFLDNMLMTTVVPIIPEYLFKLKHPNETIIYSKTTMPATTAMPLPETTRATLKTFGKDRIMRRETTPPTIMQTTTEHPLADEIRRKHLVEENLEVGILFGSKALLQLITNPFVGPLTNRIGYTIPMFTGFVIMFLSTLLFAFGESYGVLFVARAFQGIGSACTSTSGMGMLAQHYPDDQERGAAMGIALGGLALGVLVGPPYGGVLYEYAGKELPFILLALLALFDGALQLLVLQPKVAKGEEEATALKELVRDPYIIIAAGSITIGNLGIAMLEPSLPIWMMETMHASSATRGAAFLPASISYLIGTNIFGPLAHRIGRWLSALIGMLVIGCCLLAIPSATSVGGLIAPNGFMGFAIGMIDASMFPQMGYLVDLRHVGVYGSIYAIADAAFCFAFALGPYFSGPIVRSVGFETMLYIIAVINFLYCPLMVFLKNPPQIKQEQQQLLPQEGEEDLVTPTRYDAEDTKARHLAPLDNWGDNY